MSKKAYLILFLTSLLFYFALSLIQTNPGYMDASYYYVTGKLIATGKGTWEPFIWNYLNDPQQLPVPAFTYWMPFTALLSAFGMWIFHSSSFLAARIPFVIFSACIPCLTVYFTSKLTGKKYYIILSACFGLLSGLYLPYLTITETFVPFFVLGALYLILVRKILEEKTSKPRAEWVFLGLGAIAGLMHLTRADGILWLFGCFILLLFLMDKTIKNSTWLKTSLFRGIVALAGYLIIMAGWFVRNLAIFNKPFPPGSNLAIWFTQYNDLFIYPSNVITFQHWLDSGIAPIILARVSASITNLGNLFASNGVIVLFPLMIAGLWKTRKNKVTQFTLIMIGLLFLVMTIVFPYAGARGGFFHSMAAFQIYLWSMAALGLESIFAWLIGKRGWVEKKAQRLFAIVLIISLLAISITDFATKAYPFGEKSQSWGTTYSQFMTIDKTIIEKYGKTDYSVMVNDSPGYYAVTGKTAIQLSSGKIEETVKLLTNFNIDYLLIDENVPANLKSLFAAPGDQAGLKLIGHINGYYVYTRK